MTPTAAPAQRWRDYLPARRPVHTTGRAPDVHQLVDVVPALIWALTPEGRPCFINRRLCDWIGIPPARIASESRETLALEVCNDLHPEDSDAVIAELTRALRGPRAFSMRYRQRRLSGDYRWIECAMEPAVGASGAVEYWYGVGRDIETEVQDRRRRRQTLDVQTRADRAATMSEMSAAIAHEVNQPLAAILADAGACARWLERSPPDTARALRLAARIADQAEAAGQIVHRTAALFRRDMGDQVRIDLGAVVQGACGLMDEEVRAAGATLALDLEAPTPAVDIDPVQIRQLIVNLIRNGLEAMSEARVSAPRITVRLRSGPGSVRLDIADRGPGVDEVGQIFDPFFTTKPEGAGMGLAICRSIVQAHGGSLWVEPNAPAGARFCAQLPVAAETL